MTETKKKGTYYFDEAGYIKWPKWYTNPRLWWLFRKAGKNWKKYGPK